MKAAWSRIAMSMALLCGLVAQSEGQRSYAPHSVLAAGNWYKLGVSAEGVYRMDAAFFSSLGISGAIPSGQIRLFGRRTAMLSEANSGLYEDDLSELSLHIEDGGDGVINNNDYVVFYSRSPHQWQSDTPTRRHIYQHNLYSEKVFYYLSIGGVGKRVSVTNFISAPSLIQTSFDERYAHELDSVNFLSSGKEWYGEELGNLPGRPLSRQFAISGEVLTGSSFTLVTKVAARAVNVGSRFDVLVNGNLLQQIPVPVVGTGLYDVFARQAEQLSQGTLTQNSLNLAFNYIPGSFNSQGWINSFQLFYRKPLTLPSNGSLSFRDWASMGNNAVNFKLQNASVNTKVWEISDPLSPVAMRTELNGTTLSFINDGMVLREYVAFGNSLPTPEAIGRVPNQDLHQTSEADYLIIAHPSFISHAQRLAGFHQQRNLRTVLVTTSQVFNEFSAGIPDPAALRDFVKMYYDRYRATWNERGKYLLLFGKGSFDYKDRVKSNTSFVPAYESASSLDPLNSYTSDDFFGFLDDGEDINAGVTNLLDIGIGRIPVKNETEAKNFVDKLFTYHEPAALGAWRNNLNFIADDEDFNLHLQDAEVLTATVQSVAPVYNPYKIYLDAFRQESSSAGGRYPQANELINNHIYNGTLIWNYSGHGGPQRLAEEVVLDQQIVNSWNNANRLPLFITATCDFAPYDNPLIPSLGENLLVRPKTGAIALMTTSRVVFAYSNRILNNNYLQFALARDTSHRYKTLGEAMKAAKNYTYQTAGDIVNNRKFVLLGDPAMTLAFPKQKVKLTRINGADIIAATDTLSATEMVLVEGEVTDNADVTLNNFNGSVNLTLFDKPQTITTLANDATSQPVPFQSQTAALFKGKASVINGRFSARFRLPKDINYQYGAGRFSLYAENGVDDGNGFTDKVIIGGIAAGGDNDTEGPVIKAYLNDDLFINGSITNAAPVLLLKLFDSSGINTGQAGIDHDIVATLDDDNRNYYVLNDFYETEQDSYQQGSLRFQLPRLSPGPHRLRIKAWDVLNNSSEIVLEFTVVNDEELQLDHVLNYPNPFTTSTAFWFEHNKPGIELQVKVEIFSVSGRLIKTIRQTINNDGNRSKEVNWDGRDEYGAKIGRGVYLYRLSVQSADGKKANRMQRLVIVG